MVKVVELEVKTQIDHFFQAISKSQDLWFEHGGGVGGGKRNMKMTLYVHPAKHITFRQVFF